MIDSDSTQSRWQPYALPLKTTQLLDKLESDYCNWQNLSSKKKCSLLDKTYIAFAKDKANVRIVHNFCLYVLGSIPFNLEKEQIIRRKIEYLHSQVKKYLEWEVKGNELNPKLVHYVAFKENPFLIFGDAAKYSQTIKESIEKKFFLAESLFSCKKSIKQETLVFFLSLFDSLPEKQAEMISQITSNKQIKEIQKGDRFFNLHGTLHNKISDQCKEFLIKKFKKYGIPALDPSPKEILENLKICDANTPPETLNKLLYVRKYFSEIPEEVNSAAMEAIKKRFESHTGGTLSLQDVTFLLEYLKIYRKKENFIFDPSKLENNPCFADYLLFDDYLTRTSVDVMDPLFILNSLNHLNTFYRSHVSILDNLKDSVSKSPKKYEIMNSIVTILKSKPTDESYRNQLLEIVKVLPKGYRIDLIRLFYQHQSILSKTDPIFQFILQDFKDHVYDKEISTDSFINTLVKFLTIPEIVILFKDRKPGGNLLTLIDGVIEWLIYNEHPGKMIWVEYSLEVLPSSKQIAYDLARFFKHYKKFDYTSLEEKISTYFDTITNMGEAYPFLYHLCEATLEQGNREKAVEYAKWESKITAKSAVKLPPLKFLF